MSKPAPLPTAPTTLAILLGASAWPKSPGFQASEAFVQAARGFRNYLLDPDRWGLPAANLLDLFDVQDSASDQLEALGSFLEERTQARKRAGQAIRDVLVYFVGHGGFAGSSHDFYLLLRRTNANSLRASGIAIDALAEVLREKARQMRRYLFLDCCFAAAAFRAFQGGPDQVAITKTLDAFAVQARSRGLPSKGTVLLCSSDHTSPSLLMPDESCTMFTYTLLDVLMKGDPHRPRQMSLRDVKELAEDVLAAWPEKNAPRPSLHSPDQSEGDVADIPLFPNPHDEEEQRRPVEADRPPKRERLTKAVRRHGVSHPLIGTLIGGRYKIREHIATGGMAIVFKGWDRRQERLVAVKTLRSQDKNDPKAVERFRRAASVVASLAHPNAVTALDFLEEANQYFLIMEYIPGPTLNKLIAQRRQLPSFETLEIASQVCAVLQVMHARRFIHRNIKPQHIMLTSSGTSIGRMIEANDLQVKLIGFGIVQTPLDAGLLNSGIVLGTADYFSPEQVRGQTLTASSDLYSLGVVMFEMLAGRPPFVGPTAVSIAALHATAYPPSLSQFNANASPQLERIISRALEKEPEDRFHSAAEMQQALQQALQHPYI